MKKPVKKSSSKPVKKPVAKPAAKKKPAKKETQPQGNKKIEAAANIFGLGEGGLVGCSILAESLCPLLPNPCYKLVRFISTELESKNETFFFSFLCGGKNKKY